MIFRDKEGFRVKRQISGETVDCISDSNTKFLFPISTDNLVDKCSIVVQDQMVSWTSTVDMCANVCVHASKVSLASTSEVKFAQLQRKLASIRNRSPFQESQN